jgi:hypothetical protein
MAEDTSLYPKIIIIIIIIISSSSSSSSSSSRSSSSSISISISISTPRRCPYFDVVVGLVWSHDPKSYAGGSVCYW